MAESTPISQILRINFILYVESLCMVVIVPEHV